MGRSNITSDRIFKILDERGITQKELSKRTGIPTSTISDWKTKGNTPTADKVTLVCKALQISPEEILGNSGDYMLEHRVISKDEPLWELIEVYDRMERSEQKHLLKYIDAFVKAGILDGVGEHMPEKSVNNISQHQRIGVANGKMVVPDNIDECNDEIAKMFGVD